MLEVSELKNSMFGPVNLTVEAGQCVAIRGESGAGKSVLLRAIADLDPAEGTVSLKGQASTAMSAAAWRSLVTLVPAQPGWWADRVDHHFNPADKESALGLFRAVSLPSDAWQWDIDRLSTGEAQRIALIRALMGQPEVLLLDEPTASLDNDATRAVEKIVAQLQDAGRAIVLVTHDLAQATRLARRRFVMSEGQLGSPPPGETLG